MSRRHQPRRAPPPEPSPSPSAHLETPPRRTHKRWLGLLGALALGIVVPLTLWLRSRANPAPLPAPSLAGVDQSVATTIQKHLDAVRLEPRSATAWGRLGIVLREYGFKPEAQRSLEEAERLDPTNPRWSYAHAILLIVHQPLDAAVQLERVVALCGSEPEAPRYRLAKILAEDGRWTDANRELAALLQAKPDFAPARFLSALGAQVAGNLEEAIAQANRCANDPRTQRAASALLAALYHQQGKTPEAEAAARRSASLPPDEGFDDPFEAEAILLRGDPRALTEYAHPLLAAGRLDEAGRLIERLVKEHADYPETWLLQGRLEMLSKQLAAAEQSLRHHLELAPRSAQGWFQLGTALLSQNRFPEAAAAYAKATEIKPDFGPAFFNQAMALARAGRLDEAMAALRETIRHNPEHLDSYLRLAELLLRAGRNADALPLLEQARNLNPADPRLASLLERARQIPAGTNGR